MNRRIRKKKRVGEFQELGFEVSYRLPGDLSSEQCEEFLCRFIVEAVEANNLAAGGGGANPASFFVVSAKSRRSVTDEQREAVKRWLSHTSEVTTAEVGPLRDAWHGWDENRVE